MGCLSSKTTATGVEILSSKTTATGAAPAEGTPCSRGDCIYFMTGHGSKTHCCNACQNHNTHGPRCKRLINPAAEADHERELKLTLARAGDPYNYLKCHGNPKDSTNVPGSAAGRKLNVVCLHGITMTGEAMKGMAQPLLSQCGDIANFYFPSGPHACESNTWVLKTHGDGWCKKHPGARTWSKVSGTPAAGGADFKESLFAFVEKEVPGPVDVLLGYSQGGYSIAALPAVDKLPPKLKAVRAAVILMSGGSNQGLRKLRSLHVIGLDDKVVSPEASTKAAASYDGPVIAQIKDVDHSGPFAAPCNAVTLAFLRGLQDFHGSFPTLATLEGI